MDNRIIVESINTGRRNTWSEWYRDLIWLYDDGTWEKIFRSESCCDLTCISGNRFRGLTREQAIAKLEVIYYNGDLKGRFLDS